MFSFYSHYGDLGNITADENGVAKIDITDKLVTIVGRDSVVGRAIVVRRQSTHTYKNQHCLVAFCTVLVPE